MEFFSQNIVRKKKSLVYFLAIAIILAPIYHPLKKVPDVVFLPYLLFSNTLPSMTLSQTKPEDINKINITAPSARSYYAELLNMHRAEKLGLLTKNWRLVNVFANGRSSVYLVSDQWSKDLLAKAGWPDDANILVLGAVADISSEDTEMIWKSYTHGEGFYEAPSVLLKIIRYADNETFKKSIGVLLDLDKFYKWNALRALAGNTRQSDENITMLFNTATGMFEIVPADISIASLENNNDEASLLTKRILSIDAFKEERNKVLREYIENKANLKDDVAFYDRIDAESRSDFFRDFSKEDNNFVFWYKIKTTRKRLIENFDRVKTVLENKYSFLDANADATKLKFGNGFERFPETWGTIDEFLATNYQFLKQDDRTIILPPGSHAFRKTVIIPVGVDVIIKPGATLFMDKGVSIISYSPVVAEGIANQPIRVVRSSQGGAWGTFAVINTKRNKSIINHVRFEGGSGAEMDGAILTGMVAFHNADVDIENSSFNNAGDDDGLNVKYGTALIKNSYFSGNYSDGIDIDFAGNNTRIVGNRFIDNGYGGGGDGIDLSWSKIVVENNTVHKCTDKGVSVGENSKPIIKNNKIEQCDIGIAVKDSSVAQITNNSINQVRIGVAAYQKKDVFAGGNANLKDNTITNTIINYEKDDLSSINIQ